MPWTCMQSFIFNLLMVFEEQTIYVALSTNQLLTDGRTAGRRMPVYTYSLSYEPTT